MEKSEEEEKPSIKKLFIFFIIGFILFALFNKFIWHKYVVHPTAGDALKDEIGQSGLIHNMDNDNSLAVVTLEKAFHVYTVSRGFLGWNIQDEIALEIDEETEENEPFTVHRTNLELKKDEKLDTILIISRDPKIGYITAYDEDGNSHGFNGQPNDGVYLYFTYSQDGYGDNLTFEAYTYDDECLYTK